MSEAVPSLFDLEAYYADAREGRRPDPSALAAYLKGFDRVILWGAGVIGEAVARVLLDHCVSIRTFWDRRAAEMGPVCGLPVVPPFEGEAGADPERTAVIVCISSLMAIPLTEDLHERGYPHVIHGYSIFQAHACPFDAEGGIGAQACHCMPGCNPAWCERLHGIVEARNRRPEGRNLHINVVSFIVNQRCTLTCKHCTSYMNRYPREERVDFPLERILEDIDRFMDAMDSVGHLTIMGGEPFLHPDIGRICARFATKRNFGTAIVATSGTCVIRPEQLEGMRDPRICVSVVNYLEALPEGFARIYHRNLELLQSSGVQVRVNPSTPEWRIPSTLFDLGDSEETLRRKKEGCCFPTYAQVKNGRLVLCDFANALHFLKVADYPEDSVDIASARSSEELRSRIATWLDRPYFRTCGHCAGSLGLVGLAAEQGYMDFMQPISDRP